MAQRYQARQEHRAARDWAMRSISPHQDKEYFTIPRRDQTALSARGMDDTVTPGGHDDGSRDVTKLQRAL